LRCDTDIYDLRLATLLARETDNPKDAEATMGELLAYGEPGQEG